MHIFYVDESYDDKKCVLTAVFIEDAHWRPAFDGLKAFRKQLRNTSGIHLYSELHAHDFIRNLSDGISPKFLSHADRRGIYESVFNAALGLPIRILNICLDVPKWGTSKKAHEICIERLANRIQATMKAEKSHAVVVFDEGREPEITKLVRKMSVFNYIPSKFGIWIGTSATHKNIVLDRMIEDPVFKPSHSSYFLQLSDFIAFSLLKQEVPTPFVEKWGYNKLFPMLKPKLFLKASSSDPMGIVR